MSKHEIQRWEDCCGAFEDSKNGKYVLFSDIEHVLNENESLKKENANKFDLNSKYAYVNSQLEEKIKALEARNKELEQKISDDDWRWKEYFGAPKDKLFQQDQKIKELEAKLEMAEKELIEAKDVTYMANQIIALEQKLERYRLALEKIKCIRVGDFVEGYKETCKWLVGIAEQALADKDVL